MVIRIFNQVNVLTILTLVPIWSAPQRRTEPPHPQLYIDPIEFYLDT